MSTSTTSTISLQCPNSDCGFTGRVQAAMAGKTATCKKCGTRFKITDPSEPDSTSQEAAETPIPQPATPEPPPIHQDGIDLGINFADPEPGWQSPPATSQRLQARLRQAVPFIPIAARVSMILGIICGLDWLKHFLNPFEALPSPNSMVTSLLFSGPAGVINSLFSPLLAVKLLLLFWLSRMVRSWWRNRSFTTGGVYGSAAWATETQLASSGMLGKHGLLLGRVPSPHLSVVAGLKRLITSPLAESDAVIRYLVTALSKGIIAAFSSTHNMICIPKGKYVHLLTVAPAGAGKGVGGVIPNLLNYNGSLIAVDPKGENFKATAKHRRTKLFSNVLCLAPFPIPGVTGSPSATFNPFDLLHPSSPTLVDDAKAFAEALIVRTDNDPQPFWNNQAAMFTQAVILLVACHSPVEKRNLNMVRTILTNTDILRNAIKHMLASTDAHGMIARLGGQMQAMEEKVFSSVLATANQHLGFLDSPLVAANVATSSFDMMQVAESPTSLYLVLPPEYLSSHAGLTRLWLICILHCVKKRGASEKNELLFILDEVAQLGHCVQLEQAVTLLRGYGLRLWFFLQSLDQLKTCFPREHANVLQSNFGVQQFFGVNDMETAKYISARIGKTTLNARTDTKGNTRSRGWSWPSFGSSGGGGSGNSSDGFNSGVSVAPVERDLIRPEEVLMAHDRVFIFAPEINPIMANRLTYYSDPEFQPALNGTGLVTAPSDVPATTPEVSRCSYAVAACGILLVAGIAYSMVSASIRRQQVIEARREYAARKAEKKAGKNAAKTPTPATHKEEEPPQAEIEPPNEATPPTTPNRPKRKNVPLPKTAKTKPVAAAKPSPADTPVTMATYQGVDYKLVRCIRDPGKPTRITFTFAASCESGTPVVPFTVSGFGSGPTLFLTARDGEELRDGNLTNLPSAMVRLRKGVSTKFQMSYAEVDEDIAVFDTVKLCVPNSTQRSVTFHNIRIESN